MKIIIDTNCYIGFLKGNLKFIPVIQTAELIYFPFVVLAELRAGFLVGSKSNENEKSLFSFLNSKRVTELYPDNNTTNHYAYLFYQLRKQGTPIPTNDIWIAALTIQHNLTLVTLDRHFDNLPQLARC